MQSEQNDENDRHNCTISLFSQSAYLAHMICTMVNVQNNAKYPTQCQDKKKTTKSLVIWKILNFASEKHTPYKIFG